MGVGKSKLTVLISKLLRICPCRVLCQRPVKSMIIAVGGDASGAFAGGASPTPPHGLLAKLFGSHVLMLNLPCRSNS